MKKIFVAFLLLLSLLSFSQQPAVSKSEAWKTFYRATPIKINDLIHTKLDVSFDFSKSWMYGKEWVTLKPHFYPTDSLYLDAKRMEIKEVSVIKDGKHVPVSFTYDSLKLRITLDKTYSAGEAYTVFIDYVAKPDEIKAKGSAAISGAKGLYFINPKGTDKNKPTQVWTQGETESNSAWVPTIDKPNQKTTDEITMTVPAKFITLSNGLLVKKKKNRDGTRTDTWKMDLPHAPYLMMMAAGDFSIVKDSYKGKEVSYYVEKEYEPYARKIFGLTPEMIKFFSDITGVAFPWQKYSQIVVRDYVSGAMENTTATVHAGSAQQDARQLVDGNSWEEIIAHELFHMWFGDLVTTESWSNLTINESFADFSEILWLEYKHGKDAAAEHNIEATQNYLFGNNSKKELVRFYYRDREDVFDAVSYQKGGRILNMLRNYVGDEAFYKALNLFLTTHKFKSAEAQELRLAFEEITGQDLNWFWNQWYYGSGHPKLEVIYSYNENERSAKVIVRQTQADKLFRLPVAIDIYQGGGKKRYNVVAENRADTFSFPVVSKPDLINFDGDKILLCEKTENKTIDNYIFQYRNAGSYPDRYEAINFLARNQTDDPRALKLLVDAINDSYKGLRIMAIQRLNIKNDSVKSVVEPILRQVAESDKSSLVRAAAIDALDKYENVSYRDLFIKSLNDSSYSIAGSALTALATIDSAEALVRAKEFSGMKVKGDLARAVDNIIFSNAGEDEFETIASEFGDLPVGNRKFNLLQPFSNYLKRINNEVNFRKGIDMITGFRDELVDQMEGQQILFLFNGVILNGIAISKLKDGKTELAEYVKSRSVQKTPK